LVEQNCLIFSRSRFPTKKFARRFVLAAIVILPRRPLSPTTYAASTAKLWITEMHGRVVDQCLQFLGGYGFMRGYEICRLYADARALRIYGGPRRSCASFAKPLAAG
jgi:alkylation response protein AidB-like acyl-CoA dehydrogenase